MTIERDHRACNDGACLLAAIAFVVKRDRTKSCRAGCEGNLQGPYALPVRHGLHHVRQLEEAPLPQLSEGAQSLLKGRQECLEAMGAVPRLGSGATPDVTGLANWHVSPGAGAGVALSAKLSQVPLGSIIAMTTTAANTATKPKAFQQDPLGFSLFERVI